MMDANSACRTVLLIRLGTPDAVESSAAELPQAQLEEQMTFVEAALLDCGLCQGTRISNNALIGLFPSADSAFGVACSVQQACRMHEHGSALADVRILLDRLPSEIPGDITQSTTNRVRERVEHLIKKVPPGQIFATGTICGNLTELSYARFQLYKQNAADAEKGEQLCQVICNEETITRIAIPTQYKESASATLSLNLRWRENTLTLIPESPSLTIGRGDHSDIQIESELASRSHARLGFQQTNFILTDQSTNGTFVQIDKDDEVFLHNEQIVLRNSGVISLGRHIRAGRGKLIYFKLTTEEHA